MAHEPEEVIKHQMLETRASLAEKLETLEQQVVGTVHGATSAVTDTVECVKEAVQQTVELAKTSVQDTVDAVKDSLDLSRHVCEHPWVMLGGSVAVGYAAGYLLNHAEGSGTGADLGRVPSLSTLVAPPGAEGNGVSSRTAEMAPTVTPPASTSQSLLGELGQTFEGELNQLKGLALGTLLGVVRDMITSAAPPQIGSQVADIINSATLKLGGQPIHGPVLNLSPADAGQREDVCQRTGRTEEYSAATTPRWSTGAAGTVD